MDFERGIFHFDDNLRDDSLDGIDAPARPSLRAAIIGTYPPRQCGIATFTCDIVEQLGIHHPEVELTVYALDRTGATEYPDGVRSLAMDDPEAYRRAAEEINASDAEAVWLQHEYGIFGGEEGEMVCDFVDRLAPPLVLTLHTVLREPGAKQRAILDHLLARASRIMVMSVTSRDLLVSLYGAAPELIEVIEHGAPDRAFGRAAP
jgi:hypothetical protein